MPTGSDPCLGPESPCQSTTSTPDDPKVTSRVWSRTDWWAMWPRGQLPNVGDMPRSDGHPPTHTIKQVHPCRRTVVKAAIAVAGLEAITACRSGDSLGTGPGRSQAHTLLIPPLAASTVSPDGTRVFHLTAQQGTTEFVAGRRTATLGYDGPYLGPTLRAARGERVQLNVTNSLAEPTTLHCHGMHLPAVMDGGPHQPIAPGETWSPTFTIAQAGATLWYHPHPHGQTEHQVYAGLSGLFILDDSDTTHPDLPQKYGIDDLPLIVQDKSFDDDAQLVVDDSGNEIGTLGRTILVNGVVGAVHTVTSRHTRLRILNASTARTYNFGFSDRRSFELIATDGGLLHGPLSLTSVRLSPAERAEIVLTMTPGSTVTLRSTPPDLGRVAAPVAFGGTDTFDILRFHAADTLARSATLPVILASFGLRESQVSRTRSFELSGREINGARMDMSRIDTMVALGSTEVWQVLNRNPFPHNFHIHDVQFEVLSIDGAPPPPGLQGRKDTVYLEPFRTYRLIMVFQDYADPVSPYMYHCHLLLHEDQGMMGQFLSVKPGDAPSAMPLESS